MTRSRDLSSSPRGGDERPGEPIRERKTGRQAIKEAQAILGRHLLKRRDLVAELIAERREEAERG